VRKLHKVGLKRLQKTSKLRLLQLLKSSMILKIVLGNVEVVVCTLSNVLI